MRTLTETLAAAQKRRTVRPYVKAEFSDHWGDRARFRFSRYYAGEEAAGPAACCIAVDGSLVRARVDGTEVYVSRVASPDDESDYSSWTKVADCDDGSPVAMARHSGSEIDLWFVHTDGALLRLAFSNDHGASWSVLDTGNTEQPTASSTPTSMAFAFGSATGDRALFWNEGATVYWARPFGPSNPGRTAWTNSVASVTGLAVKFSSDWCVAVTGTETTTDNPKVWTVLFGAGVNQTADTWGALNELTGAVSGSEIVYHSPAVESVAGNFRVMFVEEFEGDQAYQRLHVSTLDALRDFDADFWSEPVAFVEYPGAGESADYGVAATASAAGLWLVAAAGVWSGAVPAAAFDASGDVVEADVRIFPGGARVRLVLDNSHGRYSVGGANVDDIGLGRRLKLSFGCRTSEGLETSTGPAYWVTGVVQSAEYRGQRGRAAGRSVTIVEARDAWHLLETWRARRQFQWDADEADIAALVAFVFSRAGLEYTGTGSAEFEGQEPAFTIGPGDNGAAVVARLLEKVPDRIRMRAAQGNTVNPASSDASTYTYGTEHLVYSVRNLSRPEAVNRARVFGTAVMAEVVDYDAILQGGERLRVLSDVNLTTEDQVEDRGGYLLREAEILSAQLEMTVPVNCGQELYDVVTVSEALTGLSSAKQRVLGLRYLYSTLRPRWELELLLGLP